jgi:hypothetical protein
MNIGFHSFYQVYNQNRMFLDASSPIGDDLMYPFVYLGQYLKAKGHSFSTIDMEPLESYDAIIFFDYPTKLNKYFRQLLSMKYAPPMYLVICEPYVVRPDNWDKKNHKYFRKIFTSNLSLVEGDKYIYLNLTCKIERDKKYFSSLEKQKFCTLISSNKYSNRFGELYSKRREIIRWFERYHPNEFDLYGIDWDKLFIPYLGRANFLLAGLYKVLTWLPRFKLHTVYKGRIGSKRAVLSQYKFAICFENAIASGYVTEKIFDCFMAGVVPVYLGAPEIEKLIPKNTYIDMRNFPTFEELYRFMSSMSEEQHLAYLDEMFNFLGSEKVMPWTPNAFAKTLENGVLL